MSNIMSKLSNVLHGNKRMCEGCNKEHYVHKFPEDHPTPYCKHLHGIRKCKKALKIEVRGQVMSAIQASNTAGAVHHPVFCCTCGSPAVSLEKMKQLIGKKQTNIYKKAVKIHPEEDLRRRECPIRYCPCGRNWKRLDAAADENGRCKEPSCTHCYPFWAKFPDGGNPGMLTKHHDHESAFRASGKRRSMVV